MQSLHHIAGQRKTLDKRSVAIKNLFTSRSLYINIKLHLLFSFYTTLHKVVQGLLSLEH